MSDEELDCCGDVMFFVRATANGGSLFRCPYCGSRKVFAANLCPSCTEPQDECVCAELEGGAQ